jgi:subtilisin family serine protease
VPNDRALQALADDLDVASIIPNRRVHVMAPPGACTPWPACKNDGGDTGDGSQETPTGVTRIGADMATGTGAGVGVAIVDTGLDYTHGDLDVVSGDPCFDAFGGNCQDDNGHGTHVGGIVAALDNDQDVVGVAPGAVLYGVKVLDSTGFGSDADVIAGLDWVLYYATRVDPPIRVVNMSLGDEPRDCGAADWTPDQLSHSDPPDNPVLREVLQDLTTVGITVVVAAGNDRTLEVKDTVPAGCAEVIAVASTTAVDGNSKCRFIPDPILADTASFFTTDGAFSDGIGVTISAPGEKQEDLTCGTVQSEGILSLLLGGGTTRKNGTSMASPHVAGVVALMLQADPTLLSPENVRTDLRATADLWGDVPLDPILGTPDGEKEGIVSAAGL